MSLPTGLGSILKHLNGEYTEEEKRERELQRQEKERKMTLLSAKFVECFGHEGDTSKSYEASEYICKDYYCMTSEVIHVWDTSIMSSGKAGVVLAVDAIHVKDVSNYTTHFCARYTDIDDVYYEYNSALGMDLPSVNIRINDGSIYKINLKRTINLDCLLEFLKYAISLY